MTGTTGKRNKIDYVKRAPTWTIIGLMLQMRDASVQYGKRSHHYPRRNFYSSGNFNTGSRKKDEINNKDRNIPPRITQVDTQADISVPQEMPLAQAICTHPDMILDRDKIPEAAHIHIHIGTIKDLDAPEEGDMLRQRCMKIMEETEFPGSIVTKPDRETVNKVTSTTRQES